MQQDTMRALKIAQTKDYNLFKGVLGNRKISVPHLKSLKEEIEAYPELLPYNPILVNEKMLIIDGQHRAEACRQLDLPIYYQVGTGLGLKEVQLLNSTRKSWVPMDYAISFKERGFESYAKYINLKLKYKLNHEVIMTYLSLDTPCTGTTFKMGKMKAPDFKKSDMMLQYLKEVGAFFERYHSRHFAKAFYNAVTVAGKDYDHQRMLEQLKKPKNRIVDRALPQEFQQDLEKYYNRDIKLENRVRMYLP